MADDQRHAHRRPVARHAHRVERDLLGQVGDPDQHELREGDVAPEADEGEQQLAQVVHVLGADERTVQVLARRIPGQGGGDDQDGERAEEAAGEVVDAEDGREPHRVQAHQPVEGGEGDDQRHQRQRPRAQVALLLGQRRIAGDVLADAEAEQPPGDQRGDQQVADGPADEEADVQVAVLLVQEVQLVLGEDPRRLRVHPGIQLRQVDQDGDDQQQEQRHGGGHRLQRPADDHHPLRAEGVEDHQQDERAERDARPVGEADQVGEQGRLPVDEQAGDGDAREDDAHRGGLAHGPAALEFLQLELTDSPARDGCARPPAPGPGWRCGRSAARGRRPPPPSARAPAARRRRRPSSRSPW